MIVSMTRYVEVTYYTTESYASLSMLSTHVTHHADRNMQLHQLPASRISLLHRLQFKLLVFNLDV